MLKKGGLTKHARFAKRTPEERKGKWTTLEDMLMLHV